MLLAPMLLATFGCIRRLPTPELTPTTLSLRTPLQRPASVNGRRVNHAARPPPPTAAMRSEAQTAEKERLFRGFVDWQGTQEASP